MAIPFLGPLICKIRGRHKRGVPMSTEGMKGNLTRRYLECPRCGRVTSYRKKADTVVQIRAAG